MAGFKTNPRPRACALLSPGAGDNGEGMRVLGGQDMGYPENHGTVFFCVAPFSALPFVAIRITFPVAEVPYATFSTKDGHAQKMRNVTIKLQVGTWTSSAEDPHVGRAAVPAADSSAGHLHAAEVGHSSVYPG